MENSSTARIASAPMSSGRRRSRSTQAPAKKPTRSTARLAETTSSAISSGPGAEHEQRDEGHRRAGHHGAELGHGLAGPELHEVGMSPERRGHHDR